MLRSAGRFGVGDSHKYPNFLGSFAEQILGQTHQPVRISRDAELLFTIL